MLGFVPMSFLLYHAHSSTCLTFSNQLIVNCILLQQRIIVKVSIKKDKDRSKAMKIAVGATGTTKKLACLDK